MYIKSTTSCWFHTCSAQTLSEGKETEVPYETRKRYKAVLLKCCDVHAPTFLVTTELVRQDWQAKPDTKYQKEDFLVETVFRFQSSFTIWMKTVHKHRAQLRHSCPAVRMAIYLHRTYILRYGFHWQMLLCDWPLYLISFSTHSDIFSCITLAWVSRFLTAHQHILGYLVPYSEVEDTVKESTYNARVKWSVTRMDVTIDSDDEHWKADCIAW